MEAKLRNRYFGTYITEADVPVQYRDSYQLLGPFFTSPTNPNTDNEDGNDDENFNPCGNDLDGDGIPDSEDPHPTVADEDNDGSPDGHEQDEGTDTDNSDTDGDGLTDGEEEKKYKTDPNNPNSDKYDAWLDGKEVHTYYTNPNNYDSDGDGINDDEDVDPLVDLKMEFVLKRVKQLDPLDLFGPGDFMFGLEWDYYINGWPYSGSNKESGLLSVNKIEIYPNWKYTFNVPDNADEIWIQMYLKDFDFLWTEWCDISPDRGWNWEGVTYEIWYDLRNGRWNGQDLPYGKTSGEDDGSVNKDENDCLIEFNIYELDGDGDKLPYYKELEIETYPNNPDTDGDQMPDGYEWFYGSPHGGWQHPKIHNERYAVIIVGGGYDDPYEGGPLSGVAYYPAFWNDGWAMYNKLIKDYKYKPENVYLMSSRWYCKYNGVKKWRGYGPGDKEEIDGEAMWDVGDKYDIKDALEDISNKITNNDLLLIVIIAHGNKGAFYVRGDIDTQTAESYPSRQSFPVEYDRNFAYYINQMFGGDGQTDRKYAAMIIINQACYSGSMMPYLKGENRILISAARSDEIAHTEPIFNFEIWMGVPLGNHFAFLYEGRHAVFKIVVYSDERLPGFILSMGSIAHPVSIYYMFERGYMSATHNYIEELVGIDDYRDYPQIDDDFNGLSAEDGDTDDGQYASKIYL